MKIRELQIAVIAATLFAAISARAEQAGVPRAAETPQHFSIAGQPLAAALMELGAQSGAVVIAPTPLTVGKAARPVDGDMTLSEALQHILADSGLTSARATNGSVMILAASESGADSVPATDAGAPATGLEEVLVTATRRAEALSKVPVSVATYDQARLDQHGIKSITELAAFTPGISYRLDPVGITYEIAIRGVSSEVGASTTGIYIDDTPIQARSGIAENVYPILFDQERVEVLRGPQGTLFGAGAQGGALRFITPEPSLSGYSGYSRAELSFTKGGDPSYEAGAAVGGALVEDRVGFRVSAFSRTDGGFIDSFDYPTSRVVRKNSNSVNTKSFRGALKFAASENLTFTPSVLYQRTDASSASSQFWDVLSDVHSGDLRSGYTVPEPSISSFVLPALKVEWRSGDVQLISNTSYFYNRQNRHNDYTPFVNCLLYVVCTSLPPLPTPGYFALSEATAFQNSITQEIRAQSTTPSGRWSWLVGAFYQHTGVSGGQTIEDTFLPQLSLSLFGDTIENEFGTGLIDGKYIYMLRRHVLDEQLALFGQTDFALTDRLKLTAGLRASHTQFSFTRSGAGALTTASTTGGDTSEHPVTPKVGMSYQLDDADLFYLSAGKGYRIGGANTPFPTTTPRCLENLREVGLTGPPAAVDSDSIWSYELGSKNRFADGRAQLFASVYYIRWTDIQQAVHLPGCGSSFQANLGSAISKGFDLALQARPLPSLLLTLDVGYTDAKFAQTLAFTDPGTAPPTRSVILADGDSLGIAPWTGTLAAQYDFVLGNRAAFVRADYLYSSKNNTPTPTMDPQVSPSFGYDPALQAPPSTRRLNVRAGVDVSGVNLSVFADNLLNAMPVLSHVHDFTDETFFYESTFRPRTIGMTASYRF